MASIQSIVNVLGKLYPEFLDEDEWADFYAVNDVGLPLAVTLLNDVAVIANDGEQVLRQTWQAFCDRIGLDPEPDYWDLDEVWEAVEDEDE